MSGDIRPCDARIRAGTVPLTCNVVGIMAIKQIRHVVDDLDGTVLDEGEGKRVVFAIDGREYEIDLSDRNADRFFSVIAPFVGAARPAGRAQTGPRRRAAAERDSEIDLSAVREWARGNGYTVGDRGRIPSSIVDAFLVANS